MSALKIEAFLSVPPSPNDVSLSKLLDKIASEFGEKVKVVIFKGGNELLEKYNLTAVPAVVVEEMIKMMGFCPSKETLISALHESGLE